jgi:3-phosphoglycerate kinase
MKVFRRISSLSFFVRTVNELNCSTSLIALFYLHARGTIGDTNMKNDPIIEEIHQIREQYAEKFAVDLDAMFANLKRKEEQTKWQKVVREPKNPINYSKLAVASVERA